MPEPLPAREPLLNVPNLLSLARVPLAVVLFACIVRDLWFAALVVFAVACVTDWLDGWWARRYGPLTLVGRNLDPLADKVLVCGAFIYLIPVTAARIDPWMATVVVVRELLVTGLRGMVEAAGKKFGADWFGKLKTILQCVWLVAVLVYLTLREHFPDSGLVAPVEMLHYGLLYAMLAATVLSGLQYIGKAYQLLYAPSR